MGHKVSHDFNSTVDGADKVAVTAMGNASASSTDNARQSNIVQDKVDNIVQTNPVEQTDVPQSSFDLGAARKRLKQLREHVVPNVSQQDDYSSNLPDQVNKSKFAGRSINDLLVMEIFAGSARLTKACRGLGMRAVAVDKTQDRSEGSHIFQCDVTNESDRQSLVAFLEAERDNLGWVHFAPACGTASKAREREQPGLERKGFSLPKPLRSELHPLGLPGLTGVDKLRTETANLVYEVCAQLVTMLVQWGVCCTIENPTNSLFWCVPCIKTLVSNLGGYDCIFDNCCHGGQRKKSSKFWCSQPWFQALVAQCPGATKHFHKPWKPAIVDGKLVYPTAEEAAYPHLLCARLAELCRQQLLVEGAVDPQDMEQQQQIEQPSMHRLVLSALPRGKKFKPLVSEYGSYVVAMHSLQIIFPENRLPSGAHLVHQRIAKWGEERVDDGTIIHESLQQVGNGDQFLVSQFGIPREPMDFLQRAVECGHPRGMAIHLPDNVKGVLEEALFMDPSALALFRCNELKKWTIRASELAAEEKRFKDAMPEHLRRLLHKKRLLVFGEMLESVGYPDKDLIRDISSGFKLTGWQAKTKVFPSCVKRPQFDVATLHKMSQGLNKTIVNQLEREDDDDPTVLHTWNKTMEEVELGFIWKDENPDWQRVLLAKRFGLVQKAGKLRVIDDCSIGGINSTLGTTEKYRIHAIDECAAYLAFMLDLQASRGKTVSLKGRTFDMKAAYKQYGVDSQDRDLIRLAVRNPVDHAVSLFGVNSLPFGATGSVGGFLRISMAVWYLGLAIFKLPWTAYFDDYTVFSRDELVCNTSQTICNLFDLLGIDFAREGDKAGDFSDCFKSLGVEIRLDRFSQGAVLIGHTHDRCEELRTVLGDILNAGSVSPKQAMSLRGRMHWFESFAFGRVANSAVKVIGDVSLRREKLVKLNLQELNAIRFLHERVVVAPPLNITPSCLRCWLVFTDGACEGPEGSKVGSIGGVLVNPDGNIVSFFGGIVPADIMDLFMQDSKNLIYELEVLPVLVASRAWGKRLASFQVCWYLDNEAARSACIKAYGATLIADRLVNAFIRDETDHQIKSWFGRVPSLSNIADAPSRCEDSFLRGHGVQKVNIDWHGLGSVVLAGS